MTKARETMAARSQSFIEETAKINELFKEKNISEERIPN